MFHQLDYNWFAVRHKWLWSPGFQQNKTYDIDAKKLIDALVVKTLYIELMYTYLSSTWYRFSVSWIFASWGAIIFQAHLLLAGYRFGQFGEVMSVLFDSVMTIVELLSQALVILSIYRKVTYQFIDSPQ